MKAYAIIDTKNDIKRISFNTDSETDCIEKFCENTLIDWGWYLKIGYRCVPVEITEIKPNDK